MLEKYDEEIDGEKKKGFRLNAVGCAEGERERELQAIREALRNDAQTLQMPALQIASEYYTEQEMVSAHTHAHSLTARVVQILHHAKDGDNSHT